MVRVQACPAAPPPSAAEASVVPDDASCMRCVPRTRVSRGADAADPLASSAPPSRLFPQSVAIDRRRLLNSLGAQVRALEGEAARWLVGSADEPSCLPRGAETSGHAPGTTHRPRPDVFASPLSPLASAPWTLGEAAFDACLPGGGLDPAGLIELKPGDHGDWPATLAFAVCLAVRRQLGPLDRKSEPDGARLMPPKPVLCCTTPRFTAEHGRLHGPGLAGLGLPSDAVIMVDAPREADALWVLEEGLRSGGISLAVGFLKEVDLTPSRRLGLAASAGRAPALLLTPPSSPPAPSASLRLRLRRLPGASHPLDRRAPGASRVRLTLERCRGASLAAEALSLDLEWCDVTYRFRLAADVADRAHATQDARHRA